MDLLLGGGFLELFYAIGKFVVFFNHIVAGFDAVVVFADKVVALGHQLGDGVVLLF